MNKVDKDDLERHLRTYYKEFFELKEENGYVIYPAFNTLPSKKDYPDYYDVIQTPVSFNTLKKRVPHYTEPQPFLNDVVQMFWNARVYNAPGSDIYKYARIMEKLIMEKIYPRMKKLYPFITYPYPGPLPEEEDEQRQLKMIKKNSIISMEKANNTNNNVENKSKRKVIIKKSDPNKDNVNSTKNDTTKTKLNKDSHQTRRSKSLTNKPTDLSSNTNQNIPAINQLEEIIPQKQLPPQLVNNNNTANTNSNNNTNNNLNNNNNNNNLNSSSNINITQSYDNYQDLQQAQIPSYNVEITSLGNNYGNDYMETNKLNMDDSHNNTNNNNLNDNKLKSYNKTVPDFSPDPDSHSGTPQQYQYSKSVAPKAHIRRGRPPVIDLPFLQRIKNILKYLKKQRDQNNKSVTIPFEKLSVVFQDVNVRNLITNPICLDDIRKKAKWRKYKDFQSFQNDINLLISNNRLFYKNDMNMLRCLNNFEAAYNMLARAELAKPDRNFLPEGEVRIPLEEVELNNVKYHIGDWVLLRNPNENCKPTVGQIFRLWSMPDGSRWLNACWYFRPEQTVHRVDRLFYKHEVMKTGQYRDHLVSDLVGKCFVVHFTRYQRGDPDVKLEGPLFVCEFRYNESDKVFNKIRTWKACLPEELRDQDERTIPVPGRKFFKYPSPIRHLLPPNATINDRIPQPKMGSLNAPPIVGAVYLRPQVERDDLGEYSTSNECPKHIIKPGDHQEDGKIDYEMGLITTQPSASSKYYYNKHHAKSNRSSSSLASERNSPVITSENQMLNNNNVNNIIINGGNVLNNISNTTMNTMTSNATNMNNFNNVDISKLKPRQLHRLQEQQLEAVRQQQQQQQTMKNQLAGYNLATVVNNLTAQATRNNGTPVVVDVPNSYVLPISITKNIETLQRTDPNNDFRRNIDKIIPRKRTKGEVVWFRGPSIKCEERLLNSNSQIFDYSLNELVNLNKKGKYDYLEYEEEILDHARATRHKKKDIMEDDEEFIIQEEPVDCIEKSKIVGTFQMGLRPSAKYMAHKLAMNQV